MKVEKVKDFFLDVMLILRHIIIFIQYNGNLNSNEAVQAAGFIS